MFAPAGDSSAAAILAYRQGPVSVHTRRRMALGGGYSWLDGIMGIPQYFLSGQQTVTVERIPPPLQVQAEPFVVKGDSARASYQIRPPFRIRMPWHVNSHIIAWTFRTVTGYPYSLPHCSGKQTCAYVPRRDGCFQVRTYVETNYIKAQSELVRIGDARLELTCSGPGGAATGEGAEEVPVVEITRAETLSCTAATSPAGADFELTGWSFEGEEYSHTPYTDELENPWTGEMVTSGRVTATAVVAGNEQSARVDVVVNPRDWSNERVRVEAERVQNGRAPGRAPLPELPTEDDHLGHAYVDTRIPQFETVAEVSNGPNRSMIYLTRIPLEVQMWIVVNEEAIARGSAFYRRHERHGRPNGSSSRIGGTNWCTANVIPRLEPLILAHEGVPPDPATSHVGAYQAELDRQLDTRVEELEATFGSEGFSELYPKYAPVVAGAERAAYEFSKSVDTTHPIRVRDDRGRECRLDYFPESGG